MKRLKALLPLTKKDGEDYSVTLYPGDCFVSFHSNQSDNLGVLIKRSDLNPKCFDEIIKFSQKYLGADFLSLEEACTSYCSPIDYWPEGIQALKFAVNKVERKAEEITQARTKKILAYLRAMKQAHATRHLGYQPT